MGVEVGLLGPVTLRVDGQDVPLAQVRRRAVLAVLAASTSPVPADRLAEAVWSDTGRPASRSTLHVHVHQLRQSLGGYTGALLHTPAGYRLDGVAVDVRRAEDLLRRARAADRGGDAGGAAALYRSAVALWRGEFCADLADLTYLHAARTLYRTVRLDALEAAFAAELRIGAPGLAAELDALVEQHPLRERLWGQLMVALHRDGRQADALGAYRRARRVLAAEVGLDPGTALRHLERAILERSGTTALLSLVGGGPAGGERPALVWLDAGGERRACELPIAGRVVIGRGEDADVRLSGDPAVSRTHAEVAVRDGVAEVADLGSRNGTLLNGVPVATRAPLRPGDLLRCGESVMVVSGAGEWRADGSGGDASTAG